MKGNGPSVQFACVFLNGFFGLLFVCLRGTCDSAAHQSFQKFGLGRHPGSHRSRPGGAGALSGFFDLEVLAEGIFEPLDIPSSACRTPQGRTNEAGNQ